MGSGETRSEIISLLMKETAAHGFEPFHVRNPSMGYIYNRQEAPKYIPPDF